MIARQHRARRRAHADEVMFDAEHFFDGYKANPDYALDCLKAALEAGARWIVLCDTNGGTLPHEVERIVGEVAKRDPGRRLGIHCHNDTENAVANSLAAVRAGARQVQGTLNGLGERCGNANLVSLIPTLMLKTGLRDRRQRRGAAPAHPCLAPARRAAQPDAQPHAAYVGASAFAHKGGLHVSAVEKDPRYLRARRPGAGRQPPRHRGLGSGRPRQLLARFARDRPRGRCHGPEQIGDLLDEIKDARVSTALPMTAPRPASSCWRAARSAACRTTSASSASASSTSGAGTRAASWSRCRKRRSSVEVGGQQ